MPGQSFSSNFENLFLPAAVRWEHAESRERVHSFSVHEGSWSAFRLSCILHNFYKIMRILILMSGLSVTSVLRILTAGVDLEEFHWRSSLLSEQFLTSERITTRYRRQSSLRKRQPVRTNQMDPLLVLANQPDNHVMYPIDPKPENNVAVVPMGVMINL